MFNFTVADWMVLLLVPIAVLFSWRSGFKNGLWSTVLALRDEGYLAAHAESKLGIKDIPRHDK